ncbi:hypothetical protein BJV74DRAFT_814031 [Russula compacta]|nr:hypothetical protein BJV74DRAFT_814031 [Russula compacta]
MTWAKKQGFRPQLCMTRLLLKALGRSECGLTYVEISLAEHMVPQFAPVVSQRSILKLVAEG